MAGVDGYVDCLIQAAVFHCRAVLCGGSTGWLLIALSGVTLVVMVPDRMATTRLNPPDSLRSFVVGAPARRWLKLAACGLRRGVGLDGSCCTSARSEPSEGILVGRDAAADTPGLAVPCPKSAAMQTAMPTTAAPTTATAAMLRVATTAPEQRESYRAGAGEHAYGKSQQNLS